MKVLDLTVSLTPCDVNKHLEYEFELKEDVKSLKIAYSYEPKIYFDEKKSIELIKECYSRYGQVIDEEKARQELPLNNLITLAISAPNGMVGNAHRHANRATYEISTQPSVGFSAITPKKGVWKVILSTHAVLSDVVNVKVDVWYD